jgi:hypothetical protein
MGRDADLRHAHGTGAELAGGDPVTELRGVEADGDVRVDRHALSLAAGCVHAGGDVGGHDGGAAGVDRLDGGVGGRPRRAREAGAEDGVDDDPGALEGGGDLSRGDLSHRARVAIEVGLRVGGQLAGRPEQECLDLVAGLGQEACRDEAVTPVVSLAADDARRALPSYLPSCLGNPSARRLHQLERRHSLLVDRPRVGRPHPRGVVQRRQPVARLHGGRVSGQWRAAG